jgi:hypothetical protein
VSTRGLCWCGLNRESHDGREIDAEGRMHRFNEPVYDPNKIPERVLWPDPSEVPDDPKNIAVDIRKIK